MTEHSRDQTVFDKEFTRQEPIPEAGVRRALELMETGRLHRYNVPAGDVEDAAELEVEFAAYVGARYCAALSSCGSAIYVALKALDAGPGQKVLTNAFTLAPVPGAIENAGAEAVLVEVTPDLVIDLDDLDRKAEASGARYLLLSHMRGHVVDMNRLLDVCDRRNLILIEDCAHTMGAKWGGRPTGTFGRVGCFSTQTYKHINSGEGGLLVTDDEDVAARAILFSGSYMLYDQHKARPPVTVFERHKLVTPNYSLRMNNLQAALLRPQLAELNRNAARWNERYAVLAEGLARIDRVRVPDRPAREAFVGSSIQFSLTGLDPDRIELFLAAAARRGVSIKWFGRPEPRGYTSAYDSWGYMDRPPDLPRTRAVLADLCDMRIPLTFSLDDCRTICRAVAEALAEETA